MAEPFKCYIKIGANHYREHFGLDFEEFEVGQVFEHRPGLTISQQDNAEEALDTINNAQLHYDACYASKTEWNKCLGVSTLTLQRLIGIASKTFARKAHISAFEDVAMTKPVFGGDTLYATSSITGKENYNEQLGQLAVTTAGTNQKGQIIATIKYKILVYKTSQHPLELKLGLHRSELPEKFSSHRQLDNGNYIEQTGIYFEDLECGEIYEHSPGKTFSSEECQIHALRSLNICSQHFDQHYAEQYTDGKLIASEPFVLGVLTALTTRTFGRVVANLGWNNIQMQKPVYAGESIYAKSTILSKRESKSRPDQGIMHVKTEGQNQLGKRLCSYERSFLIYKKGLGPYAAADY
ncbi:MaoC/PaaZ C-terminal domain-containing protein [Microbulbifer epialgicus]|uniref:MaoC/PaaZ C-terminal domain-containing protein n=1 Tax=Microbulbifer epialgicus TaxID=393907 RepID=A0ABV4NVV2_9GAMM